MTSRVRSPSYPSTSLDEAIEFVTRLHRVERTNVVERGVAAQAMGYTGLTGRSATVLSNLIQYGLMERAGKNEVRVTKRAVEILYPDSPDSKAAALTAAAKEPELFQRVGERFSDGVPSEAALKSFFIKEGFTDTAIPAVISAYLDTARYIGDTVERERIENRTDWAPESQSNQVVGAGKAKQSHQRLSNPTEHVSQPRRQGKAAFQWDGEKITLDGGVIATQEEAEKVIQFLTALKPMLGITAEPASKFETAEESEIRDELI